MSRAAYPSMPFFGNVKRTVAFSAIFGYPLSTMNTEWIVIDGNNLVHQAPRSLVGDPRQDFVGARLRLARRMDELAGQLARRVTIVFDGTRAGRDEHFDGSPVEVLFCGRDDSADAMIERLAVNCPRRSRMLVVTSDRAERQTVESTGVSTMSCAAFLEWLAQSGEELVHDLSARRSRAVRNVLGDLFPESVGGNGL